MRRFPDTGAERLIRIKAAVSNLWQDAEKSQSVRFRILRDALRWSDPQSL